MKAVDVVRKLMGIDFTGAPSPELGLEFRELSGEVPFVSDRTQLAKPTALRFRELTVGLHFLAPSGPTFIANGAPLGARPF
jgi:hypothetical protein